MTKNQLVVVCGVLIYVLIYMIANPLIEKELAIYSGYWEDLPSIVKFKAQSLRNMRFFFLPMLVLAGFLFYFFRDRINTIELESKEDKKQRIKKFFLRESLILLISLLVSGISIALAIGMCDAPNPSTIQHIVYYLAVILSFNYFIYLLFRFISWVIKAPLFPIKPWE